MINPSIYCWLTNYTRWFTCVTKQYNFSSAILQFHVLRSMNYIILYFTTISYLYVATYWYIRLRLDATYSNQLANIIPTQFNMSQFFSRFMNVYLYKIKMVTFIQRRATSRQVSLRHLPTRLQQTATTTTTDTRMSPWNIH